MFYGRALAPAEIVQLAEDQPARATLFLPAAQRSKDQKKKLREYFLAHDPLRAAFASQKRALARKEDLDWSVPSSMVMQEMIVPRDTYILARGDYRNHTEKVTPGVPGMLPQLGNDLPANRLGLAKWMVGPTNPLTARVAVNRYWQMYFGHGTPGCLPITPRSIRRRADWPACRISHRKPSASSICTSRARPLRWTCSTTSPSWRRSSGQYEGLQRRLHQRVVQIRSQSCGDWGHARTPSGKLNTKRVAIPRGVLWP
jgi:hypothetical protein